MLNQKREEVISMLEKNRLYLLNALAVKLTGIGNSMPYTPLEGLIKDMKETQYLLSVFKENYECQMCNTQQQD